MRRNQNRTKQKRKLQNKYILKWLWFSCYTLLKRNFIDYVLGDDFPIQRQPVDSYTKLDFFFNWNWQISLWMSILFSTHCFGNNMVVHRNSKDMSIPYVNKEFKRWFPISSCCCCCSCRWCVIKCENALHKSQNIIRNETISIHSNDFRKSYFRSEFRS